MRTFLAGVAGFLLLSIAAWTASRPAEIPFEKHTLDLGASETVVFADVNRDGKLDIVSGENWYAGPDWVKHRFRSIEYGRNATEDLTDLALEVNGDGYPDVISSASHAKKLWWDENPGKGGGAWKEHLIETGHSVEFTFLVDLQNNGKARDLLPQFGKLDDPLAWYELKDGAFVRHIVSPHSFGHGIGVGDLNSDGRNDIVTPTGWLEAPPDPRSPGWIFHPEFDLGKTGYIYVLDVNGDGRPDLVASMAHDYGFFWLENLGAGKWKKHIIDDTWSQAHALTMVDLNGDGRPDFITGKRYMAHNGSDPGEREPLGIYWYEYFPKPDGSIEWVKHIVDYSTRTGAGMQIAVADLRHSGNLDFVVGGKSGLFLFENLSGPRVRPKREPSRERTLRPGPDKAGR